MASSPPDNPPDGLAARAALATLLEQLFDATPVLIAHLDPELRFVRVNRAYAEVDGRRPEDFPGRGHFELYPNPENEAIFRRVIATGEPYRVTARPFSYPHAPERGVTHWDWSLSPIHGADGGVIGAVLALVDVTDRVRALEVAQLSEERLRRQLESSPDCVMLVSGDGRLLDVNPAGLALLEARDVEEARAVDLFARVDPSHRDALRDLHAQVMAGAPSALRFEMVGMRGTRRWLDSRAVPLPQAGGETVALAMTRDVTAERRAAAQREVMLAELDHRVKNTLATVGAIADQTLARATSLPDFRDRFTGRLHALARTHEALAAERWRGVALSRVLQLAVAPLAERAAALAPGSIDPTLPPVVVVPLGLALHELATNAVKHGALADPAGRLDVRAAWAGPGRLAVAWEEALAAPPAAPAPASAAAGLGLRLVRGLIEHELGGAFHQHPGDGGRRYALTIPLDEAAP